MSSHKLNHAMIDPQYVQVRRDDAAKILGISPSEFDRLRKDDPDCPKGFRIGNARNSPVMFMLADLYGYSMHRKSQAKAA